jgi:hypothetical protein
MWPLAKMLSHTRIPSHSALVSSFQVRAVEKLRKHPVPLFEPFVYLLPPTRAAEFCVRPFIISILIPVVTECATAAD